MARSTQSTRRTGRGKSRKKSRVVLVVVALLCVVVITATVLTPYPVAYLLRAAFAKGPAVAPDDYDALAARVTVEKDLRYPSIYRDNTADLYHPNQGEGPFPVVLWVHGGAFVGGDKKDIEIYATALAAQGYAVVCINYRRAPEAKYPVPLEQTAEACRWLATIAEEYVLAMDRLVLAGDSAGAHIAAQFTALQTNPDYAAAMGMDAVLMPDTIKATLLFCGPYDAAQIAEVDNRVMGFFLQKAAQTYFGRRDWARALAPEITLANHVTANFPPTFLADGNTSSFERHARDFAAVLIQKGVSTQTHFTSVEKEITKHEYQFVMNTPAGQEAFARVAAFLETVIPPA